MVLNCAGAALGWTPAGISPWKGRSGFGRGCARRFGGVQGRAGRGTQRSALGDSLDSVTLEGFSQLNDSVIP